MNRTFLTTAQVAEQLQLHPDTVRRMCHDGQIPFYKIGHGLRFDPVRLEQWLKDRQGRAA